jgi:hypothetical protein
VLLAFCSAVVATACVVASGRRLAWAIAPMAVDPRVILRALETDRDGATRRRLQRVLASNDRFAWESEFFAAFDEVDEQARDARVSEQLTELDGRARRWARVPRVCASIGTSTGMLLACIALLQGLAVPGADIAAQMAIDGAMPSALAALSLGIAATSFCVAVHVRAARVYRERRAAIDELVERLDRSRARRSAAPGGSV